MSLSHLLGEFAAALEFERIPAEVVGNVRLRLLDTVGVCLASVGMEYADAVYQVVGDQGESADATLLGRHGRAAAAWAAFHNGSLAHGNDYDDTHSVALVHVSGVVIPTVLALGERCRASGRAIVAAAVAGYEAGLRVGIAAPTAFHAQGFHATGVCGIFAATVSAAHLLRLDARQTAHAIGIAGSQASGLLEFLSDGAWTKRMHPGWAAHAGIVAAQLAARGFTGPASVLEGRYGVFRAYAGRTLNDTDPAFANLGREWETLNIDFKPYPCGHISHPYMDCARELRSRYDLAPDDIDAIELPVPAAVVPILCEPFADKLRPASSYAARFSLPYAVAVVLVMGRAGIDEFSEERIRDPAVLALAARTRYVIDDTLPFPQAFPGWVRMRLRDGRDVEEKVLASRGSRERPLTDAELYEKFHANVVRCLPADRARRIWETGMGVEKLENMHELMLLLNAV